MAAVSARLPQLKFAAHDCFAIGVGIFEDVDYGRPATSHGVLNYTASATNALWAAKLLEKHRRGEDVTWSH